MVFKKICKQIWFVFTHFSGKLNDDFWLFISNVGATFAAFVAFYFYSEIFPQRLVENFLKFELVGSLVSLLIVTPVARAVHIYNFFSNTYSKIKIALNSFLLAFLISTVFLLLIKINLYTYLNSVVMAALLIWVSFLQTLALRDGSKILVAISNAIKLAVLLFFVGLILLGETDSVLKLNFGLDLVTFFIGFLFVQALYLGVKVESNITRTSVFSPEPWVFDRSFVRAFASSLFASIVPWVLLYGLRLFADASEIFVLGVTQKSLFPILFFAGLLSFLWLPKVRHFAADSKLKNSGLTSGVFFCAGLSWLGLALLELCSRYFWPAVDSSLGFILISGLVVYWFLFYFVEPLHPTEGLDFFFVMYLGILSSSLCLWFELYVWSLTLFCLMLFKARKWFGQWLALILFALSGLVLVNLNSSFVYLAILGGLGLVFLGLRNIVVDVHVLELGREG